MSSRLINTGEQQPLNRNPMTPYYETPDLNETMNLVGYGDINIGILLQAGLIETLAVSSREG